jgi:hypothetical protein
MQIKSVAVQRALQHFRGCITSAEKCTAEFSKSILGCDDMFLCRSLPVFRRKVLPPSSGPKNKLNKHIRKNISQAIRLVTINCYNLYEDEEEIN